MPDHNQSGSAVGASDDGIDVFDLVRMWLDARLIVLGCTVLCTALTAIYMYFLAGEQFKSSALLLPVQTASTDQLGAAAALLGKKGSGSPDVELYQSLLTSRSVIRKLLLTPMRDESDTGKGRIVPLSAILQIDTSNPAKLEDAIKGLSKSIMVGSKDGGAGGILEVTFVANSAWLAQEIGDNILSIGHETLREIRIERSGAILGRLIVAVAQAKAEWDSAARSVTRYRDKNRSITLPDQILDLARLEMDKSAKEQKYLIVRKEFELQQLEKVKAAPPMMILDPANLPARRAWPRRMTSCAVAFLFGLVGSSTMVIVVGSVRKGWSQSGIDS